jgi:hypothetical protein
MIASKLKGLPHIYYLNLDTEVIRKKFMELQFKKWGIENYTRVSASKFLGSEFENWKHMLHFPEMYPDHGRNRRINAVSISHLEIMREWLEETDDPYMIIMEDDTDMNLIKFWHFDWEYLMNNIPYDWDAIQLCFNSASIINCYLHPKTVTSWNGPIMINRYYAKKLLRLYLINGKYNFICKSNRILYSNFVSESIANVNVDDFLGFNGKVYQIPVFSQNPYLDKQRREFHIKSNWAHYYWWRKMKDEFSLEDFFTYGKYHDNKMSLKLTK